MLASLKLLTGLSRDGPYFCKTFQKKALIPLTPYMWYQWNHKLKRDVVQRRIMHWGVLQTERRRGNFADGFKKQESFVAALEAIAFLLKSAATKI